MFNAIHTDSFEMLLTIVKLSLRLFWLSIFFYCLLCFLAVDQQKTEHVKVRYGFNLLCHHYYHPCFDFALLFGIWNLGESYKHIYRTRFFLSRVPNTEPFLKWLDMLNTIHLEKLHFSLHLQFLMGSLGSLCLYINYCCWGNTAGFKAIGTLV